MKDELLGFVVGPIQTNCYAYCSEGHCLVVDAGFSGAAAAFSRAALRCSAVSSGRAMFPPNIDMFFFG